MSTETKSKKQKEKQSSKVRNLEITGSKKKNLYFTKENEKAIIEYNNTEDRKRREYLFENYIDNVLTELIEKIVYTYKDFVNLPNIDTLKEDCKVYLVMNLDKYKEDKGSKAFSYFSVVTKNWFKGERKKNRKGRREIFLDDDWGYQVENPGSGLVVNGEYLLDKDNFLEKVEELEFWNILAKEIEEWYNIPNLKEQEKSVIGAILLVFQNKDRLSPLNKKAIYHYLREITGLNTKQVVNNLNKLRIKYRKFKRNWDGGEI